MQNGLIKLIMLLSINCAPQVQAARQIEQSTTLETELRKFSGAVLEFANENMVDTPEGKYAFFMATSILLGQMCQENWRNAANIIKRIVGKEQWEISKGVYSEIRNQRPLIEHHRSITVPIFYEDKSIRPLRRNIYDEIKTVAHQNGLEHILRKMGSHFNQAVSKAAKQAIHNGLSFEDVLKEAFDAGELSLFASLNKHAKQMLSVFYSGALAHLHEDFDTNPFRSSQIWNTFTSEYLKLLSSESLVYFNIWRVPLDMFTFRKQISMFLLGYHDETSTIYEMQRDIFEYILKINF